MRRRRGTASPERLSSCPSAHARGQGSTGGSDVFRSPGGQGSWTTVGCRVQRVVLMRGAGSGQRGLTTRGGRKVAGPPTRRTALLAPRPRARAAITPTASPGLRLRRWAADRKSSMKPCIRPSPSSYHPIAATPTDLTALRDAPFTGLQRLLETTLGWYRQQTGRSGGGHRRAARTTFRPQVTPPGDGSKDNALASFCWMQRPPISLPWQRRPYPALRLGEFEGFSLPTSLPWEFRAVGVSPTILNHLTRYV